MYYIIRLRFDAIEIVHCSVRRTSFRTNIGFHDKCETRKG